MNKVNEHKSSFKKLDPNSKNNDQNLFYLTFALLVICITLLIYFVYLQLFISSQLLLTSFLNTYSTILFSLFFSLLAFFYLLYKTKNLESVIKGLGLSRDMLTLKNIAIGISLFIIILGVELGISLFSEISHTPLPTNVQQTLAGLPIYFYFFTFLIAPINEEIFFRGFLVNKIGIVPSAIIFAVLHFGYLSISEFVAAFIFGLIAGYIFKKTRSLYTTIAAHMLLNMLTIVVLFLI